MESTVNLYSLSLKDIKTYLFAMFFVVGNILFPQLCHLVPNGGHIFLPIYFFTLIGAYKYGWKVGLLTAVASPLVNSFLFGMPAPAVLPLILVKSVLLAFSAAFVAARFKEVSLLLMFLVVMLYQVSGCLVETIVEGSFAAGFSDFVVGIPGMLVQIFGGFLVVRFLLKK